MMKKIATGLLMVAITLASFVYATQPATAANDWTNTACNDSSLDDDQKAALGCEKSQTAPSVVEGIINGIITVVGILAVIIIIVGGQRFIVSQGDPAKITAARGLSLSGVVGLIVVVLAFAIVNFILSGAFSK